MAGSPREPGRLALAALALLGVVACGGSPPEPAASPGSPSGQVPTTTAPSSAAAQRQSPAVTVPGTGGTQTVIGVIGDYGVPGSPVTDVVRRMTRFNGGRPLSAVVTTGDNAYCCGTVEQSAFARRALTPVRLMGTPIYPALGNHDIRTEDGAAFMRTFPLKRRWYTANVGNVQVVVLDSTKVSSNTQLTFLKNVLAAPRPRPFRIVAFHHPGWSCSAHSPDEGVRQRWLPLFGSKVDLVLTGHNHTYERFKSANGTPYVTTGGGGASLYASAAAACRGSGRMVTVKTVNHAVRLVATPTALRVEGVAVDGTVFDTLRVTPRAS